MTEGKENEMFRPHACALGIPLALALTAAFATPLPAQTSSAIVGVVKDETGGALPGVTVEASSPALIEGKKTTVTESDGSYQIRDLRPGEYTVVFSLEGFGSVRREGIVLTVAFTSTVNVVLPTGGVQESVTVSGRAPVVDTRTSVSQSVLSEQIKEAIPSSRNIGALLALLPGAVQPRLDVGGSFSLLSATGPQIHGSDSNDVTWAMGGMDVTSTRGGGGTSAAYYNEGLHEEVSVQTEALPAEIAAGGLSINMISKSGSNKYTGYVFASGTSSALVSDNLTDELRARGMKAPTRVRQILDVNPSFGGPIRRDRLWFFTSVRKQVVNLLAANRFKPDGTQAPDDSDGYNVSLSLTAALGSRNRVSGDFDRSYKQNWNTRTGSGQCVSYPELVEDSATYQQPTFPIMGTVKWNSALTNRLGVEAGLSYFNGKFTHPVNEPVGKLVQVDLVEGRIWGASACEGDDIPIRKTGSFVTSYAPNWKGAHNIRAGVQVQWNDFREVIPSNGERGDWAAFYRSGVPNSVQVFNLPVDQHVTWNEIGVFVQDSWTIKSRLTLNLGVRVESLVGRVDAQSAPAGRWIAARDLPAIPETPNWTTVVPRLGFVYDPTGGGTTAIKVSVSKYTQRIGESFMNAVNPMRSATDTHAWNDLNGDRVPQVNELGPSTGWTGGINTRYAPDLQRPAQWEYVVSFQRELMPALGLKATYYRRTYSNQIGTKNLAVPLESYQPVVTTNPLTGQSLTVYNQDPATRGKIDNVRDNYPGIEKYYNGFEVIVDRRLTGRLSLFGGFTVGAKKGTVTTSDLNNPNLLINNTGYLDSDATYQLNLAGTYRFPADIIVASHFNYQTGLAVARNLVVTRALVPGLTQVNQTVRLVPRGEVRLGDVNLLDVRVSKTLTLRGRVKFEPVFDIYNVLNINTSRSEVETIGPRLGEVAETVIGRIVRLGGKISW